MQAVSLRLSTEKAVKKRKLLVVNRFGNELACKGNKFRDALIVNDLSISPNRRAFFVILTNLLL